MVNKFVGAVERRALSYDVGRIAGKILLFRMDRSEGLALVLTPKL
jgi:hypothetical protein